MATTSHGLITESNPSANEMLTPNHQIYQELTGFTPRTSTPRQEKSTEKEQYRDLIRTFTVRNEAALMIQKAWKQFRMKRTYKWLRFNLLKTVFRVNEERMMTREVLKRLAPTEGLLLNDPTIKVSIRFRLGGVSFPPKIMFKIYTGGVATRYYNGHEAIAPGTKAVEDSFTVMGSRCFHEKILFPDLESPSHKIERIYEVTDQMEMIQYNNTIDKKPAHLGGRNNDWRELKLSHAGVPNVMRAPKEFGKPKRHKPRSIEKVYDLIEKYQQVNTRKRSAHRRVSLPEQTFDDDFGMLFEWAAHLDEDHLDDYEIS